MRPQFGDSNPAIQSKTSNPEATEGSGSSLSISDIVRMFTQHIWFILACVVVGFVIAKLYTNRLVPIYQATASFRMDPNRASSLGLGDLGGGGSATNIPTEIAIVKSSTVAIDVLNSLPDPVFQKYAGITKKQAALSATSTNFTAQQEGLVGMFRSELSADLVAGTQIVEVSFKHTDPEIAAVMANYTVAAYLRQNFDSRYGSVAQVSKWLSAELETLKDQAAAAQQRLSDFQEKNNIIASDAGSASAAGAAGTGNTVTDRLSSLNNRLTAAEEDRIVKEAQIRAANTGNPAMLASMFPGGQVAALQGQRDILNAQYIKLSTKFGPAYPPLIELKQEMSKVDAQIAAESTDIKARLRQQLDNSVTTENMFQQEYDALTEKAYALNRRQAEYAVLRAESTSSRVLYNTLEGKLQQAGVEAGLSGINIMLVDNARAPHAANDLRKSSTIGFGLILGLFAGLATAFLRETLSEKVRNGEQLEQILGYHLLAAIPHTTAAPETAGGAPSSSPALNKLVTLRDPMSRDAEAYRSMRNSLLISSMDKPSQLVLITSTIPAEGKSSTTANYAVVLAQKGARVLVIDADLRRPTLHKQFGAKNLLGLSNIILGEDVPDPFLHPVPELQNLFLVTAGKTIPFPSEALSSTKLYNLLSQWSREFDYVILDSAPLLIVSDSMQLASWADSVVLVTRYNVTPLGALRRVRALLQRSNVHVAGLIMNDVSGTAAGYGGYGYGYGYYK